MFNSYQQQLGNQPYAVQASQPQIQPQGTGYYQSQNPGEQAQQQQQPLQQGNNGYQPFSNVNALTQQHTGYNQQIQQQQPMYNSSMPLNQQSTGYNSMMPQTSFNQPQQMPLSTSFNQTGGSGVTGPLQPQQTGYYSQQQPIEPLKPTATGFINSFANNGVNTSIKIPSIRLSFITTQDQAKFEKLFRSVVNPGSNTITGQQCRNILMKSGLQPSQLAKIWTLSDTSKAGELLFPEFALAMHLVNSVLQGDSIPYDLDTKTRNEVSSFVDAINFSISNDLEVEQKPKTPFDDLTAGISMMQPQPTGFMPQLSFGGNQSQVQQLQQQNPPALTQQLTGGYAPQTSFGNNMPMIQPQSTGYMPNTSFGQPLLPQSTGGLTSVLQSQPTGNMPPTSFTQPALQTGGGFLQPQATGYLPPSNFQATAPLQAQKTGFGNNELYSQNNFSSKFTAENEDMITREEKSLFYKIFETYDTENSGNLKSQTAVEIFRKSGLNRSDLEHIWNLCDTNNSGNLNKQEFALGMHLVYRRLNGHILPNTLPPSLIPSSTKILNTVKDQLKQKWEDDTKKPTKADGLRFKNNDDELLPSSRNRRKTIDQSRTANENKERIDNLKRLIKEKKELLQLETRRIEDDKLRKQKESEELLRSIESLKYQIKSLPPSSARKSGNTNIPADLKSKFESLTTRLPSLLSEITAVGNELSNAQLRLYRLKSPSSVVGTGPNGEITEYDRKKAKQKQLLASRMAALTGKTVDNTSSDALENDENRYNEEVARIQEEHKKNQSIINDINLSIQEISSSVSASLGGSSNNLGLGIDKWESGIGLEPEVRDFLNSLKSREISQNGSNVNGFSSNYPVNSGSPVISGNELSSSGSPSTSSYSDFKTPEDRASYIKEQAKRRMEEKLAKLGIKNSGSRRTDSRNTYNNATNQPPAPMQSSSSNYGGNSNTTPQPVVQTSSPQMKDEHSDEDDEDEEEKKLLQQLEQLKLKKKREKKARLASLRQQVEEAKNAKDDEGNDSWDDEAKSSQRIVRKDQTNAHHQFNPFGKEQEGDGRTKTESEKPAVKTVLGSNPPQTLSGTPTGGRNPFFKQQTASSASFDAKAAEVQRRIQRGLDDDSDGWSDDEDVKEAKTDTAENTENSSDKAVPIAPQLPQISTSQNSQPYLLAPPPLPSVDSSSSTIPPPPPLPTVGQTMPPMPSVHHSDQVTSGIPPVPIAPPLPQLGEHPPSNLPENNQNDLNTNANVNNDDASDVLSIPDSVASENEDDDDDFDTPPSSILPPPVPTIPPPPPLPQI